MLVFRAGELPFVLLAVSAVELENAAGDRKAMQVRLYVALWPLLSHCCICLSLLVCLPASAKAADLGKKCGVLAREVQVLTTSEARLQRQLQDLTAQVRVQHTHMQHHTHIQHTPTRTPASDRTKAKLKPIGSKATGPAELSWHLVACAKLN